MRNYLSFSSAPSMVAALRSRRINGVGLRLIIGLIIAALLLVISAQLVDVGTVWRQLGRLSIPLALLCGLTFLSAYVVRALRWRCFLGARAFHVGALRLIMIYQVALFVNWLLPIRGGELMKSLLLRRRDNIPIGDSLSTIAMDKAMDLLPAAVLFALLPFLPFQLSRPLWTLLLTALLALMCGAFFLLLAARRRPLALWLLSSALARLPRSFRRLESPLIRFVDTLLELIVRPRLLLTAALFTAGAVGLDALFCLLAFAAVGAQVSFPVVLFGYTLFNLAFILPTPPGQIGSNELIGLAIFSGVLGVSRASVAAMFVFSHPWTALLMAASGVLCLSLMGLSVRSALSLTHRAASAEALT
jgi:uncharacterized protein (TIRG00374 family)